jgi:hypothetical protein
MNTGPDTRHKAAPFAQFLPALQYARESTRILISESGCEVASCLLALDLLKEGYSPTVVTGWFEQGLKRHPHTWVEVGNRILDPTQEQFFVPPEAEPDVKCYVERTSRLTTRAQIEPLLTDKLIWQTWNEARKPLAEEVARRHALTVDADALLRAYQPLMDELRDDLASGRLALTPVAEFSGASTPKTDYCEPTPSSGTVSSASSTGASVGSSER